MVIRIYGALIIGQFWIVWSARKIQEAQARRNLIQAYTVVFTLTTIGLLYGQLTASPGEGLNQWNWVVIGMFAFLSLYYGTCTFISSGISFGDSDSLGLT
jgi:hypothetical protein